MSTTNRRINIRRFSAQGSGVAEASLEEAERVVADAIRRGALVMDEDNEEPIRGIAESTTNVLVVDPLQGG